MAVKVNLKKYLKIEARWQFVPVLHVNGLPKPAYVVLSGEPVNETGGEFMLTGAAVEDDTNFRADRICDLLSTRGG